MAVKSNEADHDSTDLDFIMVALDLLSGAFVLHELASSSGFVTFHTYAHSGMTEGLGANIESLIAQTNTLPLLYECMRPHMPVDVRQSAFGFLGDIGKFCASHLRPHLQNFMTRIAENLNSGEVKVCNNASWALGEIAVQLKGSSHNAFG